MSDAEVLITEELERLAPVRNADAADWADVLARAATDRRTRRLALLVAIAAVAIAAPAVALSSDVRDLLGLGHPTPLLRSAKALVSAQVGNGFYAHLWRSRSTSGGTCLFSTYDHSSSVAHVPRLFRGGGACSANGTLTVRAASA